MKHLAKAIACLALFCGSFQLHGQQDRIHLNSGEVLIGEIQGMKANFVVINIRKNNEQAIRRIRRKEIQTLSFADTDTLDPLAKRTRAALNSLALRRAPLLGSLQIQDERILLDFIDLTIEAGQALEALSYAKLWHPKIQYTVHINRIEEQLIRAALVARLPDEALVHARNKIANDDDSRSALAWHVVAQARLERGDFEAALWISLNPIVNARALEQPNLDKCYATAIAACVKLGRLSHAQALKEEIGLANPVNAQISNTESIDSDYPLSILASDLSFQRLLKSNLHITP